jgi:hypothetical protein
VGAGAHAAAPSTIPVSLAGLAKLKNPSAPAVRREAEEDWAREPRLCVSWERSPATEPLRYLLGEFELGLPPDGGEEPTDVGRHIGLLRPSPMVCRSGEGDGSNIGGSLELMIRDGARPGYSKKTPPGVDPDGHRYCSLDRKPCQLRR